MQALKPTVSVITPTYQRDYLVSQAINSVLAQTYKDYEIIVINDGSQDNTPQVLAQFSDRQIVFLKMESRCSLTTCVLRKKSSNAIQNS